jgi:hypothetical protein
MPHIGHEPGALRTICGCIGQVYSVCFAGAGGFDLSNAIPHFGQLPGPACLISECIGQVYSPCSVVFVCARDGDEPRLFWAYFSGAVLNFAAQPLLQK